MHLSNTHDGIRGPFQGDIGRENVQVTLRRRADRAASHLTLFDDIDELLGIEAELVRVLSVVGV